MTEDQSRYEEYRQREFAERFGSALQTWRFEVDSHWTRTNYFSIFQAGAFVALWTLMLNAYLKSSVFLCVLGIGLTMTWLINDVRMHAYIRAWWRRAGDIEREFEVCENRQLVRHFKERLKTGFPAVKYRYVSRTVPIIFLLAWVWMFGWCIHNLCVGALRPYFK